MPVDVLLHGEMGHRLYAARGAVKATASLSNDLNNDDEDTWLTVKLDVKDGWHINANKPLQDNLIPTELIINENDEDWTLGEVEYPEPIKRRLDFQQAELALYEGKIELKARLMHKNFPPEKNVVMPQLKLQACNKNLCLPPETLAFRIITGKIGY